MSEQWILIPRWEEFQHRDAARSLIPPWIKVYTELMSKDEFLELSFHLRGVLVSMWVEYAASKRQLRGSTVALTRRLGQRVTTRDLLSLETAGFIAFGASNPASKYARNHASPEVETEVEIEKDTPPTPPPGGNGFHPERISTKGYTGCRFVRGEVGVAAKYDPLGRDRPPADWPHERPSRDEIRKALEERRAVV